MRQHNYCTHLQFLNVHSGDTMLLQNLHRGKTRIEAHFGISHRTLLQRKAMQTILLSIGENN